MFSHFALFVAQPIFYMHISIYKTDDIGTLLWQFLIAVNRLIITKNCSEIENYAKYTPVNKPKIGKQQPALHVCTARWSKPNCWEVLTANIQGSLRDRQLLLRAEPNVKLTVQCNDCKCGERRHGVFTLTVAWQLRCETAHVKHLNSQVTQAQTIGVHVDQQLAQHVLLTAAIDQKDR